jgi:integrase
MTVSDFIYNEYWPTIKDNLSPQWQRRTKDLLDMLVKSLGSYELDKVPPRVVDAFWLELRRQFKTPVTPNKVVTRGKHVWRMAIRWKQAQDNPFDAIKRLREPEHKFTPITDEEHKRLFDEAGKSLQWYMIFARYTGARRSSLAKLEERDINLCHKTITFRHTKNGENYTIPIHPLLIPWCMRALSGQPTRKVLPQYKDVHSISQLFRRLCKRCGISAFRFHDFRHNVGSRFADAGYHVAVIMSMLGHKDHRMSLRYTHISKEKLHKAAEEAL